jgi:hypothetical protein
MANINGNLPPQPPLLRIEPFSGVNYSVTPTQINQSQSPEMMNMQIDERGALNKRTGYKRLFQTSLGNGAINGLYTYRMKNGTEHFLIAHSTKLYIQNGENQPTQIYDGLKNSRVQFFTFNGKCYIMDGVKYLVFEGTNVNEVVPYIPKLTIGGKPGDLAVGTLLEDFNLLGKGFMETYSGDASGKIFKLSLTNLDATPVIAKVDNVVKTETTDFTVDRVNGKVTFINAPTKGTNNVEIIAYKTYAGFAERIKKCTFNILYGGSNDTRVFWGGNPDEPNQIWRSGLTDSNEPNYAPENGNYTFPDKVTGFSKQYDSMIVHRLNGAHSVTFDLSSGEGSFPSKPINDQVGTIAPNSIQIVENNPISLSKNGVYMLTQSSVRDERNVQHVSANVEPNLLYETGLENAVSIDYDRKYWLALNNKVYVFDYAIGEWYPFDNIPASCFIEKDRNLCFGSSVEGLVYRFYNESEPAPFNDDGQTINAYWKSKYFTFGADELRKLVEKVFYTLKPMTRTSADVYYVSNKKYSDLVKSSRMDSLDFRDIDFNNWSFIVSSFPQEAMAKIKAKKITHFQLIFENKKLDEGLGLLSAGIKYQMQSEIK